MAARKKTTIAQDSQPTPEQRSANLRIAASKAQSQATPVRFSAPHIMPGVVPKGHTAAIAMDSCSATYEYASSCMPATFQPFPGYPYLANLSTRTEYRAFAETMSSELFREWITFKGANGGEGEIAQDQDAQRIADLEKELDRLKLKDVMRLAAEHDCFFGRGQIFPKIKNADKALPLVLSPKTVKIGSLEGFANVEPMWTTPNAYNAIDPTAPDFYKPNSWWMLGEEVHASRLMTIITRPLPDMLKPAYNFGGMSLSQLAEPYVNNWLRTRQAVSDLINNFSITALKTNMQTLLQGQCDGSDLLARADYFTATRSNKGLMLLDFEAEELVQQNVPLSGLHELQSQSQEHLCSATHIPAIKWTGISPNGMNASTDGEIRSFYDWVMSILEAHYRDKIDVCIKLAMLNLWGEIDETISWSFNPLWQMSDKEKSEIRQMNANATATYIDRGVVSPEEAREALASDENSGYAGIDVQDVPEQPEPEGGDLFGNSEQLQGGEPFRNSEELSAADKSVSEKQERAMEAAAHGNSTLGIPKSVGEEFVKKDKE